MRKNLAVFPFILFLVGCSTFGLESSALDIDVACETATSALTVATVFKAQGRLAPHQIATVNDAVVVIDPICGAPTRPSNDMALDLVRGAVLLLAGVNTAAQ